MQKYIHTYLPTYTHKKIHAKKHTQNRHANEYANDKDETKLDVLARIARMPKLDFLKRTIIKIWRQGASLTETEA